MIVTEWPGNQLCPDSRSQTEYMYVWTFLFLLQGQLLFDCAFTVNMMAPDNEKEWDIVI